MKKLNLEMLRLTSADVLERSQMKKITGGYGNGSNNCASNRCGAVTCCEPVIYWCVNGYCSKR